MLIMPGRFQTCVVKPNIAKPSYLSNPIGGFYGI